MGTSSIVLVNFRSAASYYDNSEPVAVVYEGNEKKVNSWEDLLVFCCTSLYSKYAKIFKSLAKNSSADLPLLIANKPLPSMKKPRAFAYNMYIDTEGKAQDIIVRVGAILGLC